MGSLHATLLKKQGGVFRKIKKRRNTPGMQQKKKKTEHSLLDWRSRHCQRERLASFLSGTGIELYGTSALNGTIEERRSRVFTSAGRVNTPLSGKRTSAIPAASAPLRRKAPSMENEESTRHSRPASCAADCAPYPYV